MPRSTDGVAVSHLLLQIRKYRGSADKTKTLRLGNKCKAEMYSMGTDAAWKAAWITGGISTGGYAEYVRMDDAARARIDAFLDSKEGNNGMQRVAVESENMLSQPVPACDDISFNLQPEIDLELELGLGTHFQATPESERPSWSYPRIDFVISESTPESTLSFSGYPRIGASKLELPQNRLCHFQATPESLHPNPNYPRIVVCP